MTDFSMTRRRFGATLAGVAGLSLLPRLAFAQDGVATRTITTVLGTYEIPADPQRVVCIDSRLDLEPAVALGLPVIGHAYDQTPMPWVPADPDWAFVGEIPNFEQILALDPDLIICTDVGDHESDMWPIARLHQIAPVLPAPFTDPWKKILAQIGAWTGREGQANALLAEYDALIAEISARHADAIAANKIVVVQPGDENLAYLQSNTAFLSIQVLGDLGGRTAEPVSYPLNHISGENFEAVFGDADGIFYMLNTEGDEARLESSPLWQRLPAVAAGRTLKPVGNTNYGNVYTAIHIAHLFDEFYSKLS